MGGLISRPVTLVRQSVESTRLATTRLVKGARDNVIAGVSKSKQLVTNVLSSTCTAIVNRANDTKNDVMTHVSSCTTAVTDRTGVLLKWYRDTNQTRALVMRRIFYTILLLALLTGAVVAGLMLWDIYHGDYAAAGRKADAVEAFASRCSDGLFRMLAMGIRLTMRIIWLLLCYTWLCFELAFRCAASTLRAFFSHMWSAAGVVLMQGGEAGKAAIATGKIAMSYAADTSLSASHVIYNGSKTITKFSIASSKTLLQTTWYVLAMCWEYGAYTAVIVFKWAIETSSVSFEYFVRIMQISLEYLSWFSCVAFQFCCTGSEVVFDYLQHSAKVSASHISYGSRTVGNYTWSGTSYLYEHGTVAVAEAMVSAYETMIHASKVMATHSAHAVIYLYDLLQSGLQLVLAGSYSGGVLLADGSKVLLDRTNRGSAVLAEWAGVVFDCISYLSVTIAGYIGVCSSRVFGIAYTIGSWTMDVLWYVSLAVYRVLAVVSSHVYYIASIAVSLFGHFLSSVVYGRTGGVIHFVVGWLGAGGSYIANWCWVCIHTVSYYIHVVLNKHGVHYVFVACYALFAFFCQLYAAVVYLIDSAARRTWAGFSFLVHLVYSFPIWVVSLLRMSLSALVAAVTFLFRCVIWTLTEILMLFANMLHQYDLYREILFFAFIIAMVLYCSGLVRDRHESAGDDDGSDKDEIDGDIEDVSVEGQVDAESIQNAENERRTEQPPPDYEEHTALPCHDRVNTTKRDVSDDSDLGSDFELDQEVPDVMDSSGSEAELEFMRSS